MIDLYELKQFVAFAEKGTLSKVAEEYHVSTPSVTRSMQHLEESMGVELFTRGRNRIELNKTGTVAVDYVRKLLEEADRMVEQVKAYDQRQKTIVVKSCAPAPVWELLRKLNMDGSNRMVSSEICQNEEVLVALKDGSCDIGILPFPVEGGKEFMKEHLFVCVPEDHELAKYNSLTAEQINGFNFLLRTELGFWDTLCRERMPASKFLVQTDVTIFDELVKNSSLPCFTTDYVKDYELGYPGRVNIPLSDPEVNVTFYLVAKNEKLISAF